MRIVFLGASTLGYKCCQSLIEAGCHIVGILTLGNEFLIKYKEENSKIKVKNYLYHDFTEFEKNYDIPVISVGNEIAESYNAIMEWQPDLIIVVGWYFMIPEKIMKLPLKGVIGIHGSLLPKYRGNAPFVWAMINGEQETGVSLFYIEKGVDEGDIIAQKSFPINKEDYISDVLKKAEECSIDLLTENIPKIDSGNAPRITQDHSLATYFPKRTPGDGVIDWNQDAESIINFIKAQSKPYSGAYTVINGKKVILWRADINAITKEE